QTLARSASEGNTPSKTEYAELWGPREDKLRSLTTAMGEGRPLVVEPTLPSLALRVSVLSPGAPDWRLTPSPNIEPRPEYDAAWSLADAMPVNTTAPVTARDHFAVAFTAEELEARIAQF